MFGNAIATHRGKSPLTDMQSHPSPGNALPFQIIEKILSEVQARGRRRNGPRDSSKDRLVALPIRPGIFRAITLDIRRQRRTPAARESGLQIPGGTKAETKHPSSQTLSRNQLQLPPFHAEILIRTNLSRRSHVTTAFFTIPLEDERLDLPTGRALPEKPHREDPSVIEDKQVSWPQKLPQIAHSLMQAFTSLPLVHQHPRRIPRFGGLIGDQFWRQIESEIGKVEGACHTKLHTSR